MSVSLASVHTATAGAGPLAGGAAPLRVFDYEPDLLEGLDDTTARHLRQRVGVEQVLLERGEWIPPELDRAELPYHLGWMLIDGWLVRRLTSGRWQSSELIGPGDLLRPWDDCGLPSDDYTCTFRALTRSTLATLDRDFAAIAGRWPSITAALLSRAMLRARTLTLQMSIAGVRRADERVLLLLWHLADRWGRIRPDGTLLRMRLTHDLLAELARIRRPTASTAVSRLQHGGRISRTPEGWWLLHGERLEVGEPVAGDLDAAAPLVAPSPELERLSVA